MITPLVQTWYQWTHLIKKKKRGPVIFNSILSCFTRNSSLVLKETRNAPLSECDCLIPSNSNHMTPIMPYLTDDIWFFLLNYFYNKYYIPKKWFPYIASSHYVCPFSTHNTDFLAYLLQQLYWVWEAFFSWFLNTRHKAMAPYSSALAWKTPWTEEPGGLQSMGSIRVGHDWATSLSLFTCMHWRRKWQPTPVFLPGESRGWGSLVGCCLWGHTESDTTEVT